MDNLVYHADEAVSFALSINLASSILCYCCCYSDSGYGYSSLDNPYSERRRPRHPEFDLIIPSPPLSIPTHLCNHLMSVRIPCRRCQEPHLLRAARRPAVRPGQAGRAGGLAGAHLSDPPDYTVVVVVVTIIRHAVAWTIRYDRCSDRVTDCRRTCGTRELHKTETSRLQKKVQYSR